MKITVFLDVANCHCYTKQKKEQDTRTVTTGTEVVNDPMEESGSLMGCGKLGCYSKSKNHRMKRGERNERKKKLSKIFFSVEEVNGKKWKDMNENISEKEYRCTCEMPILIEKR
jgi:hypothetical protein